MGLMDMFSIRDIRSFGKGFLGARVEAMQESARVAAEQKKFTDELKANETSDIHKYNEKSKIDAKADAEKLEKIINGNKSLIIAHLQVSPEYVDTKVPSYVLENDQSTWAWLDSQVKKWGVNDWSTRKMNHGFNNGPDGGAGMTIPNYQLSQHVSNFNKSDAVGNMKKSSNVPDAIADVVTDNKKEKKQINYNGSEVFFGKPTHAFSEGNRFIHEDGGDPIWVYQREQTVGKNNWAPEFYSLQNVDGKAIPMLLENPAEWHDVTSERGKLLMNQYHPHLQTQSDAKWMVWDSNLKTWNRITGTVSTKTDNTKETIIDGGDAVWLNSIGLPGIYDEVPPSAAKKINNWSYSFEDFEKMTNLRIVPYNETVYHDSRKINVPTSLLANPNDSRKLMEAGMTAAGYITGKDFTSMNVNWINNTVEFTAFEDPTRNQAAEVLGTVVIDAVSELEQNQKLIGESQIGDDISQYKISPDVMMALELRSDNPADINQYQYVQRIGSFYKQIRDELGDSYLNKLKSFGDDSDGLEARNEYLTEQGISEDLHGGTSESLAQTLTQSNLADITTFDQVLGLRKTIDILRAEKITERELSDQAIVNTYLPANVMPIHEFVDQYVTDYSGSPNSKKQEEQLFAAVDNLTGGDKEHSVLIMKQADKYLDTKDIEDITKEKSKFQVSTEFKEEKKEEVDTLLENISLPPDFAVSPGIESISDIFQSETQIQMREDQMRRWVEKHGENWNSLMAIAEAEKPVQFMKTEPTVKKTGARTIETPAYKKWKAKWWRYIQVNSTAQDLIKKYNQE